jgi:hypothetical protein
VSRASSCGDSFDFSLSNVLHRAFRSVAFCFKFNLISVCRCALHCAMFCVNFRFNSSDVLCALSREDLFNFSLVHVCCRALHRTTVRSKSLIRACCCTLRRATMHFNFRLSCVASRDNSF